MVCRLLAESIYLFRLALFFLQNSIYFFLKYLILLYMMIFIVYKQDITMDKLLLIMALPTTITIALTYILIKIEQLWKKQR